MAEEWLAKNVLAIVIGIAVLIGAYWLFKVVIIDPMNAKHNQAAATATTAIANGGTVSAAEAINTAYQNGLKQGKIDAKTHTNTVFISKQPGANDPVNPALWDAWIRSECMYSSTAGDPQCDRLRQPGP